MRLKTKMGIHDYRASAPNLLLKLESSGRANAHFLKPTNITELNTKTAPQIENLLGISLKNITCHRKAKTISADRAIATGPACSNCNDIVNNI